MKVWITKYTCSKGLYQADVEQLKGPDNHTVRIGNTGYNYFHKGEWHLKESDAIAKAREMISRKLLSLEKQKLRLVEMDEKIRKGKNGVGE